MLKTSLDNPPSSLFWLLDFTYHLPSIQSLLYSLSLDTKVRPSVKLLEGESASCRLNGSWTFIFTK